MLQFLLCIRFVSSHFLKNNLVYINSFFLEANKACLETRIIITEVHIALCAGCCSKNIVRTLEGTTCLGTSWDGSNNQGLVTLSNYFRRSQTASLSSEWPLRREARIPSSPKTRVIFVGLSFLILHSIFHLLLGPCPYHFLETSSVKVINDLHVTKSNGHFFGFFFLYFPIIFETTHRPMLFETLFCFLYDWFTFNLSRHPF